MPIESLEDVRLFRQVVASGGITAAARALHDNKNRISQRFAALERAFGVRLADRTTRSFRLTDEGERFLSASEGLIEAAERPSSARGSGRDLRLPALRLRDDTDLEGVLDAIVDLRELIE